MSFQPNRGGPPALDQRFRRSMVVAALTPPVGPQTYQETGTCVSAGVSSGADVAELTDGRRRAKAVAS